MSSGDTANTNQHYVSQMLLRGFVIDEGAEQVWVFDKQTRRSFPTAIRNIAAERGYYDLNGSAALDVVMNEADDLTAPVISEIRRRRSLSGITVDARTTLAEFTVLQMLRTRGYQERMRHMRESIAAAVIVIEKAGFVPPDWRPDASPDQDREEYLQSILKFTEDFLPHLLDKDLLLFRTDLSRPFCISDHPVALHNTNNPGDGIRGHSGWAFVALKSTSQSVAS